MWPPPRSSRRWPSSCLDKIPVRLPEVELVRLDFLGQHAEALLIEFQLHGEVGLFVVGVPTEMVDVGVTVHDAGAPPWSLPSSSVWTFFGLLPSASDSSKVSRLKNS